MLARGILFAFSAGTSMKEMATMQTEFVEGNDRSSYLI